MPLQVDYLPIATAGGANVDSQVNFAGSGYQTEGFQAGLAQSKQLNKAWRQSSMIAAALANFIANRLGINVLDDGNLSTLIANLTLAIEGVPSVNVTPVTVSAATTAFQSMMSYAVPAGSMNTAGKTLRITAFGSIVGAVAETISIGTLIPAAPIELNQVANISGAISAVAWRLVAEITTVTAGATGEIQMAISVTMGNAGGLTNQNGAGFIIGTPIDLTSAFSIEVGAEFSVANAGNSATQNELIVEALN